MRRTGRYRANYNRDFFKNIENIEYMTINSCYYCKSKPEKYFHIWNKVGRYIIAGCLEHAGDFEEQMTAYRFQEITYEDIVACQVLMS